MRKFLVAVLTCIGLAYAYAQAPSQYPFTGADTTTYYPEVFKCITSSPGLICPGFVQTDVLGNPIYGGGNLGLGATGSAPPTTASYMGVSSGGNLQGWDRSVVFDPASISRVLPQTAAQWGLGATGSAPPTTASTVGVTSGGALRVWDRSVYLEPSSPANVAIVGTALANVNPGTASQWGLAATGGAAPTTAMNMGVTSAGNLQAWDRSVKQAPEAAWNVFVPGGVSPTTANQWGLGATGNAPPTTAMNLGITSGGNLTTWDRSVRQEQNAPWNIAVTTAVNVQPLNASQWGLGPTTAAPPTTAMYLAALARSTEQAATSGGNLTGLLVDLIGRLVNVPYAPREQALQGTASTNGSLGLIIIPAQGPNVKIYTTAIQCGRDDAGTTAISLTIGDIKGTQLVLPNSGGGGGNNATFPIPLVTTANTNLVTTPSAAVSFLRCSAQGYTGY